MKFIVVLLLFPCTISFSQHSFFGKRTSLESTITLNQYFIGSNGEAFKLENKFLVPQLELGISRQTKKGMVATLALKFQPLPNATVDAFVDRMSDQIRTIISDTFQARSNNFSIGVKFRSYRNMSPSGFYFDWAVQTNVVHSHSQENRLFVQEDYEFNKKDIINSQKEVKGFDLIPSVMLGFGNSFIINKKAHINTGFRLEIPFGRSKLDTGPTGSLPESKISQRYLATQRLLYSNLFQIYVGISIFP